MLKYTQILLLFLSSVLSASAQTKGVTFTVCDLSPTYYDFPETSYSEELEKKCGKDVESWSNEPDNLIRSNFHPFVEAVHDAYASHRPLIISPDIVWLMIAQGFAIHVDQNSESLRHYFVDFNGKKVLKVRRDEFTKGSYLNDWEGVFPEFTRQISEYTGKELLNTTLLHFSTTGKAENAAFEVTLMDAMSSYFIYAVYTSCGISQVTLEGTPADWELILEKTKQLQKYDLKWWTDELIPVLEKFEDASKGTVDKSFWEEIYKTRAMGSGSPDVSGWIIKFFPYILAGNKIIKNNHFHDHITTNNFTSGMSKADFYWIYLSSSNIYQMEFCAGFTGIQQDPVTFSLRPIIGWAIRDKGIKGIKKEDEIYKDDIMTFPGGQKK